MATHKSKPISIDLVYPLSKLPTAFHKAGLAGLVMLIDSARERKRISQASVGGYQIEEDCITVSLTQPFLVELMNELYRARTVEVESKTKWQGATIKDERVHTETVQGKTTNTKYFVYDTVQPSGDFLSTLFPDGDGLWLKLWRDMLWNIPRSRPTTRIPFNDFAENEHCKEGETIWKALEKREKLKTKGQVATEEVSSALLLGAQATTAEIIPFLGDSQNNLLLHFWPLTSMVFVPATIEKDGTTELVGYTIAVPEIVDLVRFTHYYKRCLETLNDGLKDGQLKIGYRPRRAVIDLPAESALAFLANINRVASSKASRESFSSSVSAIEFFHLVKLGNNVKTMANGRIDCSPRLITSYEQIARPSDPTRAFYNPLFRRGLIAGLLDSGIGDEFWYRAFKNDLLQFEAQVFLRRMNSGAEEQERAEEKEPSFKQSSFASDAKRKFAQVYELHLKKVERLKSMNEATTPSLDSAIVDRIVRNYLMSKSQAKSGVNLDKHRNENNEIDWNSMNLEEKNKLNEAKSKLAESLFLEFRSRRDQAFVDHFAQTFFSVTQRLSEADRRACANLLVSTEKERRDDLKTLTLLSISANS